MADYLTVRLHCVDAKETDCSWLIINLAKSVVAMDMYLRGTHIWRSIIVTLLVIHLGYQSCIKL